jgi:hypothetical protein
MDRLERSYRRLLRAFPAHYRRRRGEEMLATLLDRAPAGRRRPPFGEAVGLLTAGARCHFRVGRGPGARTAAVLAALAGAILAAMTGAWLAWTVAAPPLPDQGQALAIAHLAAPAEPTRTVSNDVLFGEEGDDYSAGSIQYTYRSSGEVSAARAQQRLSDAGWSVSALGSDRYPRLVGYRGTAQIIVDEYDGEMTVRISRAEPTIVPVLTIGGLVLGGSVGWLLAATVRRRTAQAGVGIRAAVTGLSVVTFAALFPTCFYAFPPVIRGYLAEGQPEPPWASLTMPVIPELTTFGLATALMTVLGALAVPQRSRPPATVRS